MGRLSLKVTQVLGKRWQVLITFSQTLQEKLEGMEKKGFIETTFRTEVGASTRICRRKGNLVEKMEDIMRNMCFFPSSKSKADCLA